MTPIRLRVEEYTIGCICALPRELTAAVAMLDVQHAGVKQAPSDKNNYTLGSIANFHVVIACLPKGDTGIQFATAARLHLVTTFPNIHFGFMIGIAGGNPNAGPDIRLGDIVVSTPTGTHSGVVQYDRGKSIAGMRWVQTGTSNSPPVVLRTTLAKLIANHRLYGHSINEIIKDMLDRHPRLYPGFSRDQKPRDVLYEPQPYDADENFSDWVEVDRPPRPSHRLVEIHYGLVGCANCVLKDARTRDDLSRDFGGILCFEMEAAGVVQDFPCIIIRGISDYADAHKHDDWQEYAAAVAAAYTKEFILALPSAWQHEDGEVAVSAIKGCTDGAGSAMSTLQVSGGTALDSKTCLFIVPFPRNESFVGRSLILDRLDDLLRPQDRCARVSLVGLGGVGKTQIALRMAHRLRASRPDCSIFWVHALNLVTFEQSFKDIGKQLQIPGAGDPAVDIKKLVCDALSAGTLGQWLLVVDNCDDEQLLFYGTDKHRGLVNYLPVHSDGALLFTTRARTVATRLSRASNIVPVGAMDHGESVNTLQHHLMFRNEREDASVGHLVDILGGLPLALAHAAAYINRNDVSISDYVDLVAGKEQNLIDTLSEDFEDPDQSDHVQASVAATWVVSFNQIKRQNSLAIDYLCLLACMQNQSVPVTILPAISSSRKQHIEAIGVLTGYDFVSKDEKTQTLSFHRLVRLATRNWLRGEGVLVKWLEKAAVRLCEVLPLEPAQVYPAWALCLPHCQYIITVAEDDLSPATFIELSAITSRCYYHLGEYETAEMLQQRVVLAKKSRLGASHPSTLASVAALAQSLGHQGKYSAAVQLHKANLQAWQSMTVPKHREMLDSMQYLAQALFGLGNYQEAEAKHRQAYELRLRAFGETNRSVLSSKSYLAEALRILGRFTESEIMHRETLNLRIAINGEKTPSSMASMSCLGLALRDLGRYKEAEMMQRRVYALRCEVLGERHPHTNISKRWLADVLQYRSKLDEALRLIRQVLECQANAHGAQHPDTLLTMNSLGEIFANIGQIAKAKDLHQMTLDLRTSTLGPRHPDTLISVSNLAACEESLDHCDQALVLHQDALQLRIETLGVEHPFTQKSMAAVTRLRLAKLK